MAVSSRDARYALIIAVDTYQDEKLRDLDAPLHDAEELAAVLDADDIGNFRQTEILENPDAHTAQERIERFFMERGPLDIAVLHFSGHAFRGERSDDLFLAMTDTRKQAPYATSVSGDFLRTMLERSPARRKLLLLDCCHSGALTLTRGLDGGAGVQARSAADFSDSVGRIVPSREEPHGGTGTIIIGAARAAELAHEAGTGALTEAVVAGLRTGDADLHRTGRISTENLFEYVTLWFAQRRPHQHPVLQQRSRSGQFIVAENCRYRPTLLPPELERDLADDDPGVRLTAVIRLRERALSFNHKEALTARRRLQHVAQFDVDDDVPAAAGRALLRTALTVEDEVLDFGVLRARGPAERLITHVGGPPLATGWRVLAVDHPAVAASRSEDRLAVVVRPVRPGPVTATVHVTSDAGDAAVKVTATVRRAPAPAVVAGWVRRVVTRPRRPVPAARRRVLAAAAGGVVLLTATSFQLEDRATVLGACVPRQDLRVLTTTGLRDAVEAAAAGFAPGPAGDDCSEVRVTVSTVTSDGPAQRRMADQWPDDELWAAGPSPDVWLPESSARVDLARDAIPPDAPRRLELPGAADTRLASVASSPLVLAVPEGAATTGPLTWQQMLTGRWSIPRADPRNSTTGLLTTYALHEAADTPEDAERILDRSQGGDDARYDLCRHRLSAVAPPADTAYLVTEKDVADYNAGRPLGDACQVAQAPAPARKLRPVPVTGAPALDVPCVPIRESAWGDDVQRRLAVAFCDHLRSTGRPALTEQGLRAPDPGAAARVPARERADEVIRAWGSAQRPVRMLLVMDVSGSMRLPVAGGTTPRISVTRTAAARAVTQAGLAAGDEVGLWEFATRLAGRDDYRELVPLAAATSDHQTRMADALDDLEPTGQNTGLHDTIAAGIARLGPPGDAEFPPINLLVVLTDGENDDPGSITVPELGGRLRDSGVQVSVIASVGANCRAFQPLVEQGLSCFDERKGGLAAAFGKALPARLSAAPQAGS